MLQSVNPFSGAVIAEYSADSDEAVQSKLERSSKALEVWKTTSLEQRADLLRNVAGMLRSEKEKYAWRMSEEMGKPIAQARAEVEKCAWTCDYFAEHGAEILRTQSVATEAAYSAVRFEPLGAILTIMPWNFPFWQFFRFAAPNLMVGNVSVLKHAPNVTGCALDIEEIFAKVGAPDGLVVNLFASNEQVADVICDRRIAAVTLTGSVGAGRSVAATAGSALKKCVLELGGSDPFVVLADCDLERTVEQAVLGRTQNNGQSCIAAKRFIVERPVYEQFVERFRERLSGLRQGNPLDEQTQIGPLARQDLRDELHRQVVESVEQGARCLLGGEIPEGAGFMYPPTLLVDVTAEMTAFREETFGPLASVTVAEDVEHAIALANDSEYGLGASLWTTAERGRALAGRMQAGYVAVNEIVKSDPRMPFGGIKHSGYGRELSAFGMLEFTNIKACWVK